MIGWSLQCAEASGWLRATENVGERLWPTHAHTHIYRPCPDGTLATAKEDRPKQLLIDGDSSLPPPPPLHLDCFLFHFILSASLSQVPSLSLSPHFPWISSTDIHPSSQTSKQKMLQLPRHHNLLMIIESSTLHVVSSHSPRYFTWRQSARIYNDLWMNEEGFRFSYIQACTPTRARVFENYTTSCLGIKLLAGTCWATYKTCYDMLSGTSFREPDK